MGGAPLCKCMSNSDVGFCKLIEKSVVSVSLADEMSIKGTTVYFWFLPVGKLQLFFGFGQPV